MSRTGVLTLLALLCIVHIAYSIDATVFYKGNKFVVELGARDLENGAAVCTYEASLEKIGWDVLKVETGNSDVVDEIKAYAAGYIEGYVTQKRIWTHFSNMFDYTWGKEKMPDYVTEFFQNQKNWVEDQVAQNKNDSYWQQVNLIQKQFEGLVEGYNANASSDKKITYTDLHTISSFGDLFDIIPTKKNARPDFYNMTIPEVHNYISTNTHCSAIIKVTPDLSDIFFGHTSWFTYASMTRIWKKYDFKFKNPLTKSSSISFSSYPAVVASNDDFYITSQKMVVIETTNVLIEKKLYDIVKPQALLCWQRAMLANRISTSSPEWASTFSKHNSGTYNNQFMALDLKKFTPGQEIKNDTLWIVEQIPGHTQAQDVSGVLQYGYWPSYNVPYSSYISELSGITDFLKKRPAASDSLGYQNCARANIFRRDQTKVDSIEGLQEILRYNDFKNDKLSKGDAGFAISSRNDLGSRSSCGGGYDSKGTSYSNVMGGGNVFVINGPTSTHLPVFKFSEASCKAPKQGLPDVWDFKWTKVQL